MWIYHERAALPVIRKIHVAMELTIVEGIFHEPEKPFRPVATLRDDVVDAFIVVEGLGKEVGYECAVFGLGFQHNGIKLN
jgi:hypothetical protein